MLSPHEFATLLLVANAPDLHELDSDDLNCLVERQLVALEQLASGSRCLRLTTNGNSMLRAVGRRR
ncbi:MAG: hypothetical protein ACTHKH_00430 [Trinickia sp.]